MSALTTLRVSDLVWPISYRFTMQAPWGETHAELHVDCPGLENQFTKSRVLAPVLWSLTLAEASTAICTLLQIECHLWKPGEMLVWTPPAPMPAARAAFPAGRDDSAVFVLRSEGADSFSRRRLYLPCIPRGWVRDHLLTREGAQELQTVARAMVLSLGASGVPGQLRWLLMYPGYFPPIGIGAAQVGFRDVTHVRLCQFTERQPDAIPGGWPPSF